MKKDIYSRPNGLTVLPAYPGYGVQIKALNALIIRRPAWNCCRDNAMMAETDWEVALLHISWEQLVDRY